MYELHTVEEASRYIRLAVSTLNRYRVIGGGPPFLKLGGRVFYNKVDLDAWLTRRRRDSTSDLGPDDEDEAA